MVDQETQKRLNTPLTSSVSIDPKDEEFLNLVLSKIQSGEINLFKPSSLVNMALYEKLPEEKKAHVDFEAMNLLTTIRDVKGLYESGFNQTYQFQNSLSRFRQAKERVEKETGDIFII